MDESKLRILELVNVRWWNACAEYGINLALGLHRRGHRVIVMGRRSSPPLRTARHLGLPCQPTEMESRHPGDLLASFRNLLSLIHTEGIQIINAHRAEGHLFAAWASLILNRRVRVIRTRGDIRSPKGHLLNRFQHRRLTDAVIIPAEATRKAIAEELGLPPEALRVIPPGVDMRRFHGNLTPEEGRRALGWPEAEPVVGIVGRLSPVKGHDIFLEAASRILQVMPQTAFAIVGHEAQIKIQDLKRKAENLGVVHRIRFMGFVQDLAPMMAAFDVAVVASTGSEIICRVALEHMAMARPVVGTKVNAIPEIVVHRGTGLLVPPGDSKALGEGILSLLRNPQRARALGEAGRRRVQRRFTLEHQVNQTELLYRQLLEDGP